LATSWPFVPGQRNPHRFRQQARTDLPQHVDDMRRRVVGGCADVEEDIAAAGPEPFPQARAGADLIDEFSERFGGQ
jgi:hypothetical protein